MFSYKIQSLSLFLLMLIAESSTSIISDKSHLYQKIPVEKELNIEYPSLKDKGFSSKIDRQRKDLILRKILDFLFGFIDKNNLPQNVHELR